MISSLKRSKIKIPKINILCWLQEQPLFPKFYWKGNIEVAACGAVLSWDHLPEIEGNFRIFGGRSFSSRPFKDTLWKHFPKSHFFLPALELAIENDDLFLYQNTLNNKTLQRGISNNLDFENYSEDKRVDLPSYPEWEQLILKALEDTSFKKVVLARRTTLNFKKPVSTFSILHSLREKSSAKVIFAFQTNEQSAFLGATPERLYTRQDRTIHCDAVAGTSKNKEELCDPKLKLEFSYVKEWINSTLSPFCTTLFCAPEDAFTSGYKIVHIYNCFEGLLKPAITDNDLILALHPTPAIGGFPQDKALDFIHKEEPFERGWYSAPIGWASSSASEFAVGIRSALIANQSMHLFAGLGVVQGSDPHLEWQELELKIAQFLKF